MEKPAPKEQADRWLACTGGYWHEGNKADKKALTPVRAFQQKIVGENPELFRLRRV